MVDQKLHRACKDCHKGVWILKSENKPFEKFICEDCIDKKEISIFKVWCPTCKKEQSAKEFEKKTCDCGQKYSTRIMS